MGGIKETIDSMLTVSLIGTLNGKTPPIHSVAGMSS